MNRFQLQQLLNGVQSDLKAAANKLNDMYADAKATIEQRAEQKKLVQDLEERETGLKEQLDKLDAEANSKLNQTQNNTPSNKQQEIIDNKAKVIRAVVEGNKSAAKDALNALGGNYNFNAALSTSSSGNGGGNLLPTTSSSELITEPVYENDLRPYLKITNESKLEVPKLLFSCDDDSFVADEETAKEIKATGSTVAFGQYKSKLKANVSETILLGSNTNLVSSVDSALGGAAAYKEAKQLFAVSTDSYYESHMSFYGIDESNNSLIKEVTGSSTYIAIKRALAALPKLFRKNAIVVMTYTDYMDMIESLSNGTTNFYLAQPETIFGRPIVFMDEANKPIVGDLRYLQINYSPDTLYDTDKDVDTGINKFVLTNWYDIQFLLRSAFRIAKKLDTTTP